MIYNSNTLTTQCLLLGYKTIFCALIDTVDIESGLGVAFHSYPVFMLINSFHRSILYTLILLNLQLD